MLKELRELTKACTKPLIIKLSVDDAITLDEEIKEAATNLELMGGSSLFNTVKFEVIIDEELIALYRKPEERGPGNYLTFDKDQ